MLAFMGWMLGQGTHIKARRPTLAYANIRLYVFFFIIFLCSTLGGKDMGGVLLFALCRVVCLAR